MFEQPIYINSIASIHPDLNLHDEFIPGKQVTVIEPEYKTFIPDATLRRRMSRIVKMGVATGMQCLNEKPEITIDAILTATGYGCLSDTEKFMTALLDSDEQMLAPTAFIQSTFNTIGAQIALLGKNHCYNSTYTHRAFSFESALLDAALLLQANEAQNVLVGAVDEMTPTLYEILKRLGTWRHAMAGEGANFALLSREPDASNQVILAGLEMFSGTFTNEEIQYRMQRFIRQTDLKEVHYLFSNEYKKICGEFPTVMGFAFWQTCKQMQTGEQTLPVLIYNTFLNNHSFILLKQA